MPHDASFASSYFDQDCNVDPSHLSGEGGVYSTGEYSQQFLQPSEPPPGFLSPETLGLGWESRNGSVSTANTFSDSSVAEFSFLGADTDPNLVPDLVPSSQQRKRSRDSPERPNKRSCSLAVCADTKTTGPTTRSKDDRSSFAPDTANSRPPRKVKPSKFVADTPPSSAPSSRGTTVKAPQLRTASRKPKASGTEIGAEDKGSRDDLALTSDERRARQSHNLVEKQYRSRLNQQFESLLAVLPPADSGNRSFSCGGSKAQPRRNSKGSAAAGSTAADDDRKLSKAEVLDMARQRIITLERECDRLNSVKLELTANVGVVRGAVAKGSIPGTSMAAVQGPRALT